MVQRGLLGRRAAKDAVRTLDTCGAGRRIGAADSRGVPGVHVGVKVDDADFSVRAVDGAQER